MKNPYALQIMTALHELTAALKYVNIDPPKEIQLSSQKEVQALIALFSETPSDEVDSLALCGITFTSPIKSVGAHHPLELETDIVPVFPILSLTTEKSGSSFRVNEQDFGSSCIHLRASVYTQTFMAFFGSNYTERLQMLAASQYLKIVHKGVKKNFQIKSITVGDIGDAFTIEAEMYPCD